MNCFETSALMIEVIFAASVNGIQSNIDGCFGFDLPG